MFNNKDWTNMKKKLKVKDQSNKNKSDASKQGNKDGEDFSIKLFKTVDENTNNIKKMLGNPDDLVIRTFSFGETNIKGALIFIDGLIDKVTLTETILEKLLNFKNNNQLTGQMLLTEIQNKIITPDGIEEVTTLDDVSLAILSGSTALFIEGTEFVLTISSNGWEHRNIEEPQSEGLVRGPREGFVENYRTNTMLIRRQIRDPNLRIESMKIGRRSKRTLAIIYVVGIINPQIVKEVKRRLSAIDLDNAPDTGIIEQAIEDNFLSPFPQIENSERPDKVAAEILQGRLALILDGTPYVLLLPVTLGQLFQSPEDYYERWFLGTFVRGLRYVAAGISMFLPGIYIALVSFHPGMIPTDLTFSIAASREGVPLPAVMEALLMEVTMELLREAGIRLPKPIGQTIGIVGGLVIGDAAVSAGLVSPIMVIVVALTAIASFSLPSYSTAISFRMLRFGFIFAAAGFGLYGLIVGYIIINIHIANLKSFGLPYSTPFAPFFGSDWKDLILRTPSYLFVKRPEMFQTEDKIRKNVGDDNNE